MAILEGEVMNFGSCKEVPWFERTLGEYLPTRTP
jgi:hypothetical protein